MGEEIRVLIVDDHEIIRQGIRSVLDTRKNLVVCGEAVNGREAIAMAEELKPDVVIMDIGMSELNGLEATRQITKSVPTAQVVILTMHESEHLMHEVLLAGAIGYVLKSDAGSVLVDAIENVCQGKPFFTSKMSPTVVKSIIEESRGIRSAKHKNFLLTPRERETVQLIAEGKSSKEVASILGISTKTAETHRTNLMRKLDVHSVSEIVRYAIRNGIIDA
jgi:DNA-binding NarL/FixJ family response regulator